MIASAKGARQRHRMRTTFHNVKIWTFMVLVMIVTDD